MRKFIVTVFLLLIGYLLQTTAMPAIQIADIAPNLILIIVAYSGYINGRTAGLFTGLFAGLLIDFQFGSVIGLYALIYMLVAYLCGFCHKIYFRDDATLPVIIICLSDIIYGLLVYMLEFAFRNKLDFSFYIKRIILPEMIYTTFISIFAYRIILYLYKHKRIKKNNEKREVENIV